MNNCEVCCKLQSLEGNKADKFMNFTFSLINRFIHVRFDCNQLIFDYNPSSVTPLVRGNKTYFIFGLRPKKKGYFLFPLTLPRFSSIEQENHYRSSEIPSQLIIDITIKNHVQHPLNTGTWSFVHKTLKQSKIRLVQSDMV